MHVMSFFSGLHSALSLSFANKQNMKKLLTALALGIFSGYSDGQVVSPTVGFTTLNLQTGNNFVGFNLMPSMAFQGAFTVSPTDRAKISLSNTTIANDQFNPSVIDANNPSTHAIEIITPGANAGLNTAIIDSAATGSELTLQDALPESVADGSEVRIWKLWTIGDAFGTTNSAGLTSTTSANTSDLILIPTTAGGYDQFYYSAGGFAGLGWRKVGGGNTNRSGFPIYFTDGFLILARAEKSITITGAVKPGQTTVVLETGNNFFSNLCPVNAGGVSPSPQGRTLGNSNLYNASVNGLTGASSSNSADLVLIWNGTGYSQYYYSTGGFAGTGWRQVGGGNTDRASEPLPEGAFLILRRGAPTTIALSQAPF